MIMQTKTMDFNKMTVYDKKKVLSKFFGHKVNQIVNGSLTNAKFGDFRVRHDGNAYSYLRITTTEDGYMNIVIWNYETEKWQEEDK